MWWVDADQITLSRTPCVASSTLLKNLLLSFSPDALIRTDLLIRLFMWSSVNLQNGA